MRLLSIALVVALVAAVETPASAQMSSGVSLSVQAGSAKTTGGEFRETGLDDIALAGLARLAIDRHTAIVGGATITLMGYSGDITSLCIPSRHGGCRPPDANMGGVSFRAGIERRLLPFLSITGVAGFGWYKYDGTNPTPTPAGAHGFPLELQLAVPVTSHFALVASGEYTQFRDFGGENFSSRAVLLGVSVR